MMGVTLAADGGEAGLTRELAELRASEARYRAMLAAVPDLIFRLSGDYHYLDFHIPDLPGVFPPPEHFVGKHVAEALPPHLAALFIAATDRARGTGSLQRFEYVFPMDTGPRDREARILPVEGSDETMVIVKDITERKIAERRLENLVQSKDDFIATISHELRTPITSVLGFALLLEESGPDLSDDERREVVRLISEQASELATIVEDLLVAARVKIDQLKVKAVDVDLAAEVAAVIDTMPQMADTDVRVAAEPVRAVADPVRVRQILRNLLTNAVRYGGDRITVKVDLTGETASVRVYDNGDGVSEADRDAIFDPYRSDPSAAEPGAVGLGLTVSRTLARLMHGEISYRREGAESCFDLTLPSRG